MSLNLGVMSAAVTLNDKDFRETLDGLQEKSESTFKKIAMYAAGYLSLSAISQVAKQSYKAFTVQENAVDALNDSLRKNGENIDFWSAKLQDAASKMQQITTFGDETTLQAMATAMNIGVGAKEIERATKAAMGLAAAYNIDLNSAMQLIGRASQGQTAMLTRYGIILDTTKSKEEQFAELLQKGIEFFPLAEADTASKKLVQMQNAIGDTTELIGEHLAEAILPLVNGVKSLSETYNGLSAESRSVINQTVAMAAAFTLLGKAGAIAKANMLVASGLTALKAGFTGVVVSAKAAVAAIGPVGLALAGLAAVLVIAKARYAEFNGELEASQKAADLRVASANQMADAHQKETASTTAAMQRLQDLAKYERLSNAEKEESEKLIKQITDVHKGLDIALDKTTGKLKIGASAWTQMNEEQQKTARKDVMNKLNALEARNSSLINSLHGETGSVWRNSWFNQAATSIAQSVSDDKDFDALEKGRFTEVQNMIQAARELRTLEEQISAFEKIANKLRNEGDKKEAEQADTLVKELQKQLELKKQLEGMNAGKGVKNAKEEAEELKKSATESDKIRKAIEALQNKEFSIKFNAADVDVKLEMLKAKMNKIFGKEVSGKYKSIEDFIGADRTNMTLEELKTVEKLVELRSQQAQIEKDLKENITSERQEYEKYIAQRSKNEKSRGFDKQISSLTKQGDKEGAIRLVEAELTKAKVAAEKLRKQYTASLEIAEKDNSKNTEYEKKRRAKIQEQMRVALSDEDRLKGKLENLKTSETQTKKTVGSFSLAAMQSMLGASKPEQQTAKNTKKTVELLGKMSEQLGNGSIKYNE